MSSPVGDSDAASDEAQTVRVALTGDAAPYDVTVGPGVAAQGPALAAGFAADGRTALVADERVLGLHGAPGGFDAPALSLAGGEQVKTFPVLEQVLDFCAASKLSRGSVLLAFGGGTIGDLTGLAASLFKRGLSVVQIPTTLLAQVDASVGGKTAVNLASGKNLAGTFHQPSAVLCDTTLLGTLSDGEYESGLGEVLKTAILAGEDELSTLEACAAALLARDPEALQGTVTMCVRTKARVVASDPLERGPRRSLNLGHTFGHAIEHAAGYGQVPHGVAVGVGLALAARASAMVMGSPNALVERTMDGLRHFGLPATMDELRSRYGLGAALQTDALISGLGHDKKGAVGAPEFVLPTRPGHVELGVALDPTILETLFA